MLNPAAWWQEMTLPAAGNDGRKARAKATPAHRDETAMNGAQLRKADSLRGMTEGKARAKTKTRGALMSRQRARTGTLRLRSQGRLRATAGREAGATRYPCAPAHRDETAMNGAQLRWCIGHHIRRPPNLRKVAWLVELRPHLVRAFVFLGEMERRQRVSFPTHFAKNAK